MGIFLLSLFFSPNWESDCFPIHNCQRKFPSRIRQSFGLCKICSCLRKGILNPGIFPRLSGRRDFIMTEKQKSKIQQLRQRGVGYIRIAQALGISENTIKSFCRRNRLAGDTNQALPEHFCQSCGKPVPQNPGRKEKKFCSDTCRMEWWNAQPDNIRRKTWQTLICQHCGKAFKVYGNAVRKYCCHACYVADRFGERHA